MAMYFIASMVVLNSLLILFPFHVDAQHLTGCLQCQRNDSYLFYYIDQTLERYRTCTRSWLIRTCYYRFRTVHVTRYSTRYHITEYCCRTGSNSEDATSILDGALQLTEGSTEYEGRLIVSYKDSFGSVCEDNFGVTEGAVACHQLGFAGLSRLAPCCEFPMGTDEVWLDELSCQSGDTFLANCSHSGWGVEDCHHGQDIGLVCNDRLNVRVAGGSSPFEGRVETYHSGAWGSVCDDGWDLNDAEVVCQQLGFGSALQAFNGSHFPAGSGFTMLSEVDCIGDETSLSFCLHPGWRSSSCLHSRDAGVQCEGVTARNLHLVSKTANSVTLSLQIPNQIKYTGISWMYKVKYSLTSTDAYSTVSIASSSTAPELEISSLQPYTNYEFSVAFVSGTSGPFSNSINTTTLEDLAGHVSFLSGSAQNSTSIRLQWNHPYQVNGMLIGYSIRYNSENNNITSEKIVDSNILNLIVYNLEEFEVYTFVIAAINGVGRGQESEIIIMTHGAIPAEGARNVEVVPISPSSVTVSWNPPQIQHHNGEITSYKIRYHIDGNHPVKETTVSAQSGGSNAGQSTNITGLDPYQLYVFEVLAINNFGEGPSSEPVIIRMPEGVAGQVDFLSGSALSSTSIHLQWSHPQQTNGILVGYSIRYYSSSSATVDISVGPNTLTYTIANLEEFVEYTIIVAAVNGVGRGEESEIIVQTTGDIPAEGARNVEVVPISPSSVTVSWNPPQIQHHNGEITSYKIRYHIDGNHPVKETTVSAQPGGSNAGQSTNITGLDPYQLYVFEVLAINNFGEGPSSEPVVIRMPEGVAGQVDFLSGSAQNSTSIRLQWNHPYQVNGMLIGYSIRYNSENNNITSEKIVDSNILNLIIYNLEEFEVYTFVIAAINGVGRGQESEIIIMTHGAIPAEGARNVEVVPISPSSVTVSWNPPQIQHHNGEITSYKIRYHIDGNHPVKETTVSAQPGGSNAGQSTNITGLDPYQLYVFEVLAINNFGEGPSSEPVVIRMPEGVAGQVDFLSGSAQNSTSIRLQWNHPYQVNGMLIGYSIRYNSENNNITSEKIVDSNILNLIIYNLEEFEVYTFVIAAINGVGRGQESEIIIMTHGAIPAEGARNVEVVPISPSSVTVSWNPPQIQHHNGEITSYKIRYHIDGNHPVKETTVSAQSGGSNAGQSTNITGLDPYQLYVFKVLAINNFGEGPSSETVVIRMPEGVPSEVGNLQVSLINVILTVKWLVPSKENGELLGYHIYLNGSLIEEVDAETTMFIIDVKDFKGEYYIVGVAAFSKIGEGTLAFADLEINSNIKEENQESSSEFTTSGIFYGSIGGGVGFLLIVIISILCTIILVYIKCINKRKNHNIEEPIQLCDVQSEAGSSGYEVVENHYIADKEVHYKTPRPPVPPKKKKLLNSPLIVTGELTEHRN